MTTDSPSDKVILSDTGYLVNFLQTGGVKHLTLSLYKTHLKLEKLATGELVEDIPLDQIKMAKNTSVLATLLMPSEGTNLKIKTDKRTYKISWKDIDAERLLMGGAANTYNAKSGAQKAKLWADTIKSLQAGTPLPPQE